MKALPCALVFRGNVGKPYEKRGLAPTVSSEPLASTVGGGACYRFVSAHNKTGCGSPESGPIDLFTPDVPLDAATLPWWVPAGRELVSKKS